MFDPKDLQEDGEFIELRFGIHWDYVPITRQYIHNFLTISCGDQSKAEKFAMAVSELLENAVKYSQGSNPYMMVHVDKTQSSIRGMVQNSSSPERIESLNELFTTIQKGTPMEAYVEQMKLAATRDDGKSQLGLARIRYEANAEMDIKVEGDNVTIFLKID